jgi:hypothetical protein
MACPQTLPVPGRTLMTPAGIPALWLSSANLSAVSGQTLGHEEHGIMVQIPPQIHFKTKI